MTLKDEIQAAQDRLAEAIAARDAKRAALLYTNEARLIPQGAPACTDHDAITAFFAGAIDNGIAAARFTTDEVEGDERQAVETGRYELYAAPPGGERILAASGRYLVVWRKVGGEWRMHRDMFNTQ
jgi:ketosteroid isomerase-like protein